MLNNKSKPSKINFITLKAMDMIRPVYYVHGKLGDAVAIT